MRRFLRNVSIGVNDKLLLCQDVARGLHALHTCFIAHGDVKLENVLIKQVEPEDGRASKATAVLSDFGHSLPLRKDEIDTSRRYGGTRKYNAPEISNPSFRENGEISFKKCDLWSMGLLCWEALADGQLYYRNTKVITASQSVSQNQTVSSEQATGKSDSTASGSGISRSERDLQATQDQDISLIAPFLANIACLESRSTIGRQLSPREMESLCSIFRSCLQAEASKRVDDVADLPLLRRRAR